MSQLDRDQKFSLFGAATSQRFDVSKVHMTPEQKKAAQKNSELASMIDLAQAMAGPGFPLDKKLREFAREFNNRVLMGRGDEQPQSFDVLQAFVEPDERALILKILPETYHSLELNYVLDQLTDPSKEWDSKQLMNLPEGMIYHVHIPGSYQSLQFVGSDRLGFYGTAFVRHGEELSIFGLAAKDGRMTGQGAVDIDVIDLERSRDFLRSKVNKLELDHDQFYDDETLYPLVFLTRVDLLRKTTMVRFILEERKNSFMIYSDSRHIYTNMSKDRGIPINQVSETFDSSNSQLVRYSSVFAMLREIPFAVLALESEDDLAVKRYPTELNMSKNSTDVRKIRKSLSLTEAPNYVDVRSIMKLPSETVTYDWETENFQTEQHGYWKTLPPGRIGVGKNGDKVHGRTWVTVKESWVESLGFEPAATGNSHTLTISTDAADLGFVYVMRNASHPRDQYKIGFTVKDVYDRATQLYATSGQSDQFNVVQQWTVRSPKKVEARVHEDLAAFRVNPKREFFVAKYDVIRGVIENVIEVLQANATG